MTASPAFITLENISKRFPGVLALDQINLTLNKGEVHCLAGQNGCGKSTIIKIISGVYQPEKGANISLEGKLFHALTPQLSGYYGIQVIYQDLSLFPNLTVAENIAIHRYLPGGHFWVRKRVMRQTALDAMARVGVHIDPDKKVEKLSIADRQLVAICRAIAAEARLVIMDEPTASLTRQEVDGLLRVVNELKAAGICVVFVSHRLDEVLEISDRVTVIRDGNKVGTWPAAEITGDRLTELMTGLKLDYRLKAPSLNKDRVMLEADRLSRAGQYQDVSFRLHQGEVLGLCGLLGSGRTELALSLFGMTRPDSGKLYLDSKPVRFRGHEDAIKAGIGYVSEDRLTLGLVQQQSVADNAVLTILDKLRGRFRLIDDYRKNRIVAEWIAKLGVRVADPDQAVSTLSGGNQQKIVLAKWVLTQPRILILDSPTVGVDVGAKASIYQLIHLLAQEGIAILLISDEVPEVYYNCDRVLHFSGGSVIGEYLPGQVSQQQLAEAVNA
ncbi:sugar ABC transporter ATP-binding protein [Serratia marcescens]|uniref:sugar ABC transporter ATP-binding protein n=1 Tax=Serratia marcescens TaxID=615 RepID=UPI000F7E99BC|nr:sugar ABC transporter ATP-binding protein [Serratia marcescens]RTF25891.1 sugar ABC transporter ATP-binding protein [Serratia marcescens]RTF60769.1 sugar ABC transporter ATP-binding protein [Serratia marcescens]RTF71991.1 sugar ABC transporter ATP-binding protein [Serratia marcescens]RTF92933.1 sugar ABC transporter ATP-binding protein [Serratia marcescens]RTF93497.1 sugar ABC transporter ATP-binding protein [Serratia marcescens]